MDVTELTAKLEAPCLARKRADPVVWEEFAAPSCGAEGRIRAQKFTDEYRIHTLHFHGGMEGKNVLVPARKSWDRVILEAFWIAPFNDRFDFPWILYMYSI